MAKKRESFNESQLIQALKGGRGDFSNTTLVGRIDFSFQENGIRHMREFHLGGVEFDGDCFFGDVNADIVTLEKAQSQGRLNFYRPQIGNINGKDMCQGWFSLTHGHVNGINFVNARFKTGFSVKTKTDVLILDGCKSPYSLFDDAMISKLTTIDAELGRRTPKKLSEEPTQATRLANA